jgi:ribosomal protein S18 acetylase RimI-like enzyme
LIKAITVDMLEKSGVLGLIWRVFEEFEAPDYTDEGIKEFQSFIAAQSVKERMSRRELLFWGCWRDNRLVGAIATRPPCHISLLFVDKEYHRRGIAKSLFRTAVGFYIENSSFDKMTVNSSPYAVEVYRRLGFVDTDSEQIVNGLRFTPMRHTFRSSNGKPLPQNAK